jgi:hypothetical protein
MPTAGPPPRPWTPVGTHAAPWPPPRHKACRTHRHDDLLIVWGDVAEDEALVPDRARALVCGVAGGGVAGGAWAYASGSTSARAYMGQRKCHAVAPSLFQQAAVGAREWPLTRGHAAVEVLPPDLEHCVGVLLAEGALRVLQAVRELHCRQQRAASGNMGDAGEQLPAGDPRSACCTHRTPPSCPFRVERGFRQGVAITVRPPRFLGTGLQAAGNDVHCVLQLVFAVRRQGSATSRILAEPNPSNINPTRSSNCPLFPGRFLCSPCETKWTGCSMSRRAGAPSCCCGTRS